MAFCITGFVTDLVIIAIPLPVVSEEVMLFRETNTESKFRYGVSI